MRTRNELERGALELGVRSNVLEKVERLLGILARVDGHEGLADSYALKGGTALNLFHLPLPRLSVDIDINFVGEVGKGDLGPARQRFERALVQCCQRSGCTLLRSPGEHAVARSG